VSEGLYCYAIVRGVSADDFAECLGIGDSPLRLVEEVGLGAVVSAVDLDEFGEEGLRRNLEDLAWLEQVAMAHDRVSRHASERGPTAPLRLATVFLGEESLRAQLAQWHDEAERALDRIEGRNEWSVKAYVDQSARGAEGQEAADSSPEGTGAGKAYLLKRRAEAQRREAAAQADAATADEIHAALATVSVSGRRLAAQDRKLTGHTGEMILNGTYLVDQEKVAEFKDAVDRIAGSHSHVRVELGGPWPPYSFASLDLT
jgi:hypothetical protein